MKRTPRESDLRSSNHERYATAVMQCRTHNPYCGSDGRCHAGGDCFEPEPVTRTQAMQGEIKRLNIELEKVKNRQAVLVAALEHHIQSLSTNYKQTTNENQKWAIHFARQKFLALQNDLQGEDDEK